MPFHVLFNLFSSLRVRGSWERRKKKRSCFPFMAPPRGSLPSRVSSLLVNKCLLHTVSFCPIYSFHPGGGGSEKDHSSLLQFRCCFLVPFVCAGVKPWGFRTKCVLGKKWVGFCVRSSRLGRELPSGGRSLVSLYSWKPGEVMYTTESFCSASEVFLFFVLQCVQQQQICVTPGKEEIWVKEAGSSLRLVTSKLTEKFNSGRVATRPKWKRNRACQCSEPEDRRSYRSQVKNYVGLGNIAPAVFVIEIHNLVCCLSWGWRSSPAG